MADPTMQPVDNLRRNNQKDLPKIPNYQPDLNQRNRGLSNSSENWDQSASYRQNLGQSSASSPSLLRFRNDQNYRNDHNINTPTPPGRGLATHHRRADAVDMSVSRRQNEQRQEPISRSLPSSVHPSKPHSYRHPPNGEPPLLSTGKMKGYKDERTPDLNALLEAVKTRNNLEIKQLLEKGLDVNSTETGYTAMHLACKLGYMDTIEYLLMCGADITIRDQHGHPAGYYSKPKGIPLEEMKAKIQPKKRSKPNQALSMEWMNNVKSLHGDHGLAGTSLADVHGFSNLPLGLNSGQTFHSSDHLSTGKLYEPHTSSAYHMPLIKHSQSHTDLNSVSAHKSSYDNFPSPFDYLPRTPQSSSSLELLRDYQKSSALEPSPHSNSLHMNGTKYPQRHERAKLHSPANFQSQREHSPMPSRPSPFKGHMGHPKYEFSNRGLDYKRQATESTSPFLVNEFSKSSSRIPPSTNTLSSSYALSAQINSPFRTSFYKLNNVQPDTRIPDTAMANHLKLGTPFSYYPNMYPNREIPYPMFYPPLMPPGLVPGMSGYPNPTEILPHRADHSSLVQPSHYKPDLHHIPMPQQPAIHQVEKIPPHTITPSSSHDSGSAYKNGWKPQDSVHTDARKRSEPPLMKQQHPVDHEDRRYSEHIPPNNYVKENHKVAEHVNGQKRTTADTDMRPYMHSVHPSNKHTNNHPQPRTNENAHGLQNDSAIKPSTEISTPDHIQQNSTDELKKRLQSPISEPVNREENNVMSPNKQEKNEKEEKNRKRKLDLVTSLSTSTSGRSNSSETNLAQGNLSRNASTEPGTPRREKRPRKSETEDDYFYEWPYEDFSSSEPENDDSGDEDFFCASKKNLLIKKSKDVGLASSRPMRQSSLRAASLLNEHREGSASDGDTFPSRRLKKNSENERMDKKLREKKAKSRKISSESMSSENCNDDLNETLSPKKVESSASSGRSKETKLKRKLKKLRRSKHELNKSQSEDSPVKKKRKKKNLTKSDSSESPSKKVKKEKNNEKLNTSNQDGKKIKSPKKLRPQLEVDVKSKKSVPKENVCKTKSAESKSKSQSGISKSLIELYTGPPKPCNELESPVHNRECSKQGNDLFGTEFTESEAAAFNQAFEAAKKELEIKEGVATTLPLHSNLQNETPIVASPVVQAQGQQVQSEPPQEEVKQRKKPGRKPKHSKDNSALSPTKSSKKHELKTETPKTHLKHKTENKSSPLLKSGARKGRPPGSSSIHKLREKQKAAIREAQQNKQECSQPICPNTSVETTPSKNESLTSTPKVKEQPSHNYEAPSTSGFTTPSSVRKPPLFSKSSRPSTPINAKERKLAFQSPLPPNLKKLTCNSAIGETVLHKAARHGYMENMKHYLESGFSVNAKDNAGYTALHEACVQGRLEAAKLLLQFGADVNLNSLDGTRPIHDAVEYDHIEMTRLMMSCGADPLLSKFSGRSIKNMIRSTQMGNFINAYLKELQPVCEELMEDSDMKWKIPFSAVLESKQDQGYDLMGNPPAEETNAHCMEFELFDEQPIDTYLVQPSDATDRSNYYLLNDILQVKGCSKADFLLEHCCNIRTMPTNKFCSEAALNKVGKRNRNFNETTSLIELVAADKPLTRHVGLRVHPTGEVEEIQQVKKQKSSRLPPPVANDNVVKFLPKTTDTLTCSQTPDQIRSSSNLPENLSDSVIDNHREESLACLQKLTASFCMTGHIGKEYKDFGKVNGIHTPGTQTPVKKARPPAMEVNLPKTSTPNIEKNHKQNSDRIPMECIPPYNHHMEPKQPPKLPPLAPINTDSGLRSLPTQQNGVDFSPFNKLPTFTESQNPVNTPNLVPEI
ncbi:uncharacterized protein LOC100178568 [Ciona intestinalis]